MVKISRVKNISFLLIGLLLISNLVWTGEQKKDARDTAQIVIADAQHPPVLSEHANKYYTLKYKATNPDAIKDLERLVRSYTSASSRIYGMLDSGIIQVTDTADSLKRAYVLIRNNDVKPTAEMKSKWRELEKQADERSN